jgi:hypothetical protein
VVTQQQYILAVGKYMRAVASMIVLLVGLFCSVPARAQSDCLASFDVDPQKQLHFFGWLPDGASPGIAAMSCGAAEELRTQIYVDYLANDNRIFASSDALASALQRQRASMIAKRDELQEKLQGGTIEGLIIVARVLHYEASKFFVIVGCGTPSPDPVTKAACIYGAILVPIETHNLLNLDADKDDIRAHLATVNTQIAAVEDVYRQRLAQIGAEDISATKQKLEEAFAGLCRAIQDQCIR